MRFNHRMIEWVGRDTLKGHLFQPPAMKKLFLTPADIFMRHTCNYVLRRPVNRARYF